MFTALLLLGTAVAANPETAAADVYRDAKVGDWLELKSVNAFKETVTNKQTVIARTNDEVVIKIEQSIDGKASPPTEYRASLNPKPRAKTPDDEFKSEQKTLGTGKETLTVGGRAYDCVWTKSRTTITYKVNGKEMTQVIESKTWTCEDVPLGGAVRVETEAGGATTRTEIAGFGRGK